MKRDDLEKMLGPESMKVLEADPLGKKLVDPKPDPRAESGAFSLGDELLGSGMKRAIEAQSTAPTPEPPRFVNADDTWELGDIATPSPDTPVTVREQNATTAPKETKILPNGKSPDTPGAEQIREAAIRLNDAMSKRCGEYLAENISLRVDNESLRQRLADTEQKLKRVLEELLIVAGICADEEKRCPSCGNYPNMGRGLLLHTSGTWSQAFPCGDTWHGEFEDPDGTLPPKEK
jgi:hypothetical protein